jgi:hypothetical protein
VALIGLARPTPQRAALLATLSAGAVLAPASPAPAAAVATTCASLQADLDAANDGDVLTLPAGAVCNDDYTLPGNRPAPFSITVQGAGGGATLDGSGLGGSRVMTGATSDGNVLHAVFRNLTFRDSSAPTAGGALYLNGNVSATLDNDSFLANAATGTSSGGAVALVTTTSTAGHAIAITGSRFGDGTSAGANTASSGGAIYVSAVIGGPSLLMTGNRVEGNVATELTGGGVLASVDSPGATTTVSDNVISGNRAGAGAAGADLFGRDTTLERNQFTANRVAAPDVSSVRGGGLSVSANGTSTLTQSANAFDANAIEAGSQADFDVAGGGEWVSGYQLTSRDDRFTNNSLPAASGTGDAEGGGLAVVGCGPPTPVTSATRLENAVVAGNAIASGGEGAGLYAGGCPEGPVALTVLDSTVSGNQTSAGATAGLHGGDEDTLVMRNSIAAGNIGGTDLTGFGAGTTVTSSDACAPGPFPGANNICASPFLAHAGPGFADVHQTQFSPTIDRGSTDAVAAGLAADFEGDPRVVGPAVDMGADEFTLPSVVTSVARQVKVDGATLRGTVTPNTHATSYRFEYGDTTDYGRSTPPGSLPAGTALVPVESAATGLRPNRSYHFRLVGTNSAGTTYGLDQTVKTKVDKWRGVGIADQTVPVKRGRAAIRLTCPKGVTGTCAGTLSLRSSAGRRGRKLALGSSRFAIRAGSAKRVKVKLTTKGKRAMRRRATLRARALSVAVNALGTKRKTGGNVKLERRRRR